MTNGSDQWFRGNKEGGEGEGGTFYCGNNASKVVAFYGEEEKRLLKREERWGEKDTGTVEELARGKWGYRTRGCGKKGRKMKERSVALFEASRV